MKQGRKITGGKYHKLRKKKFYEKQNQQRVVTVKETKRKTLRVKGGNKKTILLNTDDANIFNSKTKKTQKAKIKNVLETPQNVFLARQNLLLKGAIIETELGKAKITNRPSQEGCVNAILLEE
ncbi:MAG: 30S ribosomal protein S8e [Nanoarchaeota archaeon]|nr:30S ribosomal protein S8e [Nanoarchaeota archaeon]MBU1052064.1 30S ribosomal protein S8e [Nanoarchaeota archaeon]